MSLLDTHLTQLTEGSGIHPDIVAERGYYSVEGPAGAATLRSLGFSAFTARRVPGLVLPVHTPDGRQTLAVYRPDTPAIGADGTIKKYLLPPKSVSQIDCPPRCRPGLANPTLDLWLTEGQKKGDALASVGATAAAFLGVWNWKGKNAFGGTTVLADFDHIAPDNHRRVHIVFDNDIMQKPAVEAALLRVIEHLTRKGALVDVCYLPDNAGKKMGVDDYLVEGHTLKDLEALCGTHRLTPPKPLTTVPPPLVDPAAILDTVSPCTHVANARRIARRYAGTLRYVLGEGWILWTGKFWRPDPTKDDSLATGRVSSLARCIAEETSRLYSAAGQTSDEAERKVLYALAEARGVWAVHSEHKTVIAAGLCLAKEGLMLEHSAINTDPWLFNCQNGTLDLRTGALRTHNPADYITHLAPVIYDPDATCPTWVSFLVEVFENDQEMIEFIRRALGWSLTGVVQDRALMFLYGAQGHNGKTTLVEAWRDVIGLYGEESFGYARKVDVQTFMKSKQYEDNLRKAVQLVGARFVYSSEIGEDHRLNEQLIKDMTGGDTLEARRLYREAFNFKPTFKPWMYGNHLPEVRGTDDALWSRVKRVDFPVSFAGKVDLELPTKLRKEISGILNWALEGCKEWQRTGLRPPAKVQQATASYRREQDVVGQFIKARCKTGEGLSCKAAALYTAYKSWAEQMGYEVRSQKYVGAYLTANKYPSDDNITGRGALRLGIELVPPPSDGTHDDGTENDWEATFATLHPSPPTGPIATADSSNKAEKSNLGEQYATLATLRSEKSRIGNLYREVPGSKGSKGSNPGDLAGQVLDTEEVMSATLQESKGSNQTGTGTPPYGGCALPYTYITTTNETAAAQGQDDKDCIHEHVNETGQCNDCGSNTTQFYCTPLPYTFTADPAVVAQVLPQFLQHTMLGVDIETTGLRPHTDRWCLLQLASPTQILLVDMRVDLPAMLKVLAPLFTSAVHLVGDNLQFEAQWFQHAGLPDMASSMLDVMLADQLIHAGEKPAEGFGLAGIAKRYLHVVVDKSLQTSNWAGVLTPAQLAYAAADAALPLELWPILSQRLADMGIEKAYAEVEAPALPAIACIARTGLPIDATQWLALAEQHTADVQRLQEELVVLSGRDDVLWSSDKQLAVLLKGRGHTLPKTKKGQDQTTSDVLAPLAAVDPLIPVFLAYRRARKRASTYGAALLYGHAPHGKPEKVQKDPPPYLESTGRLYGQFHQLPAATGRMSSSKPNFQNFPKDTGYRQCFVAQPGYAIVKADYSQIEVRVAAVIYEDPVMIQAYQSGADLHRLTAAKLLAIPETAVSDPDRQLAKSVVFGMLFGMGARGLQAYALKNYQVVMSVGDAQAYIDQFFATYPGASRFQKQAKYQKTPAIRLPSGRRRTLRPTLKTWDDGHESLDHGYTKRMNTPVQGTACDIIKVALARLYAHRHQIPGVRLCSVVHDEVVCEVPLEQVPHIGGWLKEHMVAAFVTLLGEIVPCVVDVTIGRDWAGTSL